MTHAFALKPHALVAFPGWHWPEASQQPVEQLLDVHGFDGIPHAASGRMRHAPTARNELMARLNHIRQSAGG